WGEIVPGSVSTSGLRMRGLRHKAVDVENDTDAAITEDRAAGYPRHVLERIAQTLDHYFLLAQQLVHHHAEPPLAALRHHHHAVRDLGRPRFHAEALMQPDHGEQGAPHQDHLPPPLHCEHLLGRRAEHLFHHVDRHDIALLPESYQQSVDDRQR